MANQDYSTFTAFGGTLSRDLLNGPAPGLSWEEQPASDIGQFDTWIAGLRNETNLRPIFGDFDTDAREVLFNFFPRDERFADPVYVRFGTGNPPGRLELVDGPAALAYLFTIATPSVNDLTWNNYYLPMLALLSRCLYLAFVGEYGFQTQVSERNRITGVPAMGCVMFTEKGSKNYNRFVFGSTFAVGFTADAKVSARRRKQQILLDTWRRALMNYTLHPNPALLLPNIPDHPFTLLCPRYLEQLASILQDELWADATVAKAATIAFDAIAVSQIAQLAQGGSPAEVIPQRQVFTLDKFKSLVIAALSKLVRDRFDISYEPDLPNLLLKAQDFINLVIGPKPLRRRAPGVVELPLNDPLPESTTPVYTGIKTAAITAFGVSAGARIQTLLDDLFQNVRYERIPPSQSVWGRCAETYCFSCMLPSWWADPNPVPMNQVKGFAMEVREVGGSRLSDFSTEGLKALQKRVYRLPCVNCSAAMPFYNMDLNAYNALLEQTIPHQVPLH